eukprot:gene2159-2865_t
MVEGALGSSSAVPLDMPLMQAGLTSASALIFVSALNERFGTQLHPLTLFDYPTIASLSALICHAELQQNKHTDDTRDDNKADSAGEYTVFRDCQVTDTASANSSAYVGVVCSGWHLCGNSDTVSPHGPLVGALLFDTDTVSKVPYIRWDVDPLFDPGLQLPASAAPFAWLSGTQHANFLGDTDQFDHTLFGVSAGEAMHMDPQQLLGLDLGARALHDASLLQQQGMHHERKQQCPPASAASSLPSGSVHTSQLISPLTGSIGVAVGVMRRDWSHVSGGGLIPPTAYSDTGSSVSIIAGRLSYVFGLKGPSCVYDTACSSSLVAVEAACAWSSSRRGEPGCSAALAAGINLLLSPMPFTLCSRAGMLASDGRCKTLDAAADGFGRAEGGAWAMFSSRCIGAPLQAVARVNHGCSASLTAPSGLAQQEVILRTMQRGCISCDDIIHIEMHGTGTPLGDPIEVGALRTALLSGSSGHKEGIQRHQQFASVVLGSIKSAKGHLEGAAGLAGLVHVSDMLCSARSHAFTHLRTLNPSVQQMVQRDWGACLPQQHAPCPTNLSVPPSRPSHATAAVGGVSAFGFGGTNAHVILMPLQAEAPPSHKGMQAAREFRYGRHSIHDPGNPLAHPLLVRHVFSLVDKGCAVALAGYMGIGSPGRPSLAMGEYCDHVVGGRSLFPAAGLLEAIHAAISCARAAHNGTSMPGAPAVLIDVALLAPLLLPSSSAQSSASAGKRCHDAGTAQRSAFGHNSLGAAPEAEAWDATAHILLAPCGMVSIDTRHDRDVVHHPHMNSTVAPRQRRHVHASIARVNALAAAEPFECPLDLTSDTYYRRAQGSDRQPAGWGDANTPSPACWAALAGSVRHISEISMSQRPCALPTGAAPSKYIFGAASGLPCAVLRSVAARLRARDGPAHFTAREGYFVHPPSLDVCLHMQAGAYMMTTVLVSRPGVHKGAKKSALLVPVAIGAYCCVERLMGSHLSAVSRDTPSSLQAEAMARGHNPSASSANHNAPGSSSASQDGPEAAISDHELSPSLDSGMVSPGVVRIAGLRTKKAEALPRGNLGAGPGMRTSRAASEVMYVVSWQAEVPHRGLGDSSSVAAAVSAAPLSALSRRAACSSRVFDTAASDLGRHMSTARTAGTITQLTQILHALLPLHNSKGTDHCETAVHHGEAHGGLPQQSTARSIVIHTTQPLLLDAGQLAAGPGQSCRHGRMGVNSHAPIAGLLRTAAHESPALLERCLRVDTSVHRPAFAVSDRCTADSSAVAQSHNRADCPLLKAPVGTCHIDSGDGPSSAASRTRAISTSSPFSWAKDLYGMAEHGGVVYTPRLLRDRFLHRLVREGTPHLSAAKPGICSSNRLRPFPWEALPSAVLITGGLGVLGSLVTAWIVRTTSSEDDATALRLVGRSGRVGGATVGLKSSHQARAVHHAMMHGCVTAYRLDTSYSEEAAEAATQHHTPRYSDQPSYDAWHSAGAGMSGLFAPLAPGLSDDSGAAAAVIPSSAPKDRDHPKISTRRCSTAPPLRVVIHAAGTLSDATLLNQTPGAGRAVTGAKVGGIEGLMGCATAPAQAAPLDLEVLFSSIAALLGSPGQSNYAGTNSTLDAIALHSQTKGCPAVSVHWGGWGGAGMATAARSTSARVQRLGMDLIAPSEGLYVMACLLQAVTTPGQAIREASPDAAAVGSRRAPSRDYHTYDVGVPVQLAANRFLWAPVLAACQAPPSSEEYLPTIFQEHSTSGPLSSAKQAEVDKKRAMCAWVRSMCTARQYRGILSSHHTGHVQPAGPSSSATPYPVSVPETSASSPLNSAIDTGAPKVNSQHIILAGQSGAAVLEAKIMTLVETTLGSRLLDANSLMTDNGLDSLGAMELAVSLSSVTGLDVDSGTLFDFPTARLLTQHLMQLQPPSVRALITSPESSQQPGHRALDSQAGSRPDGTSSGHRQVLPSPERGPLGDAVSGQGAVDAMQHLQDDASAAAALSSKTSRHLTTAHPGSCYADLSSRSSSELDLFPACSEQMVFQKHGLLVQGCLRIVPTAAATRTLSLDEEELLLRDSLWWLMDRQPLLRAYFEGPTLACGEPIWRKLLMRVQPADSFPLPFHVLTELPELRTAEMLEVRLRISDEGGGDDFHDDGSTCHGATVSDDEDELASQHGGTCSARAAERAVMSQVCQSEQERLWASPLMGTPTFRALLVQPQPQVHCFVLTARHSIIDGWGISVLLSELVQIYSALRNNAVPKLVPLPYQYADICRWRYTVSQASSYQALLWQKIERYGHRQWIWSPTRFPTACTGCIGGSHSASQQLLRLSSAPPQDPLQVAANSSHPSNRTCEVRCDRPILDIVHAKVDSETLGKLNALAKAHDVTLFTVIMACVCLWLKWNTQWKQLAFPVMMAYRSAAVVNLLGCFSSIYVFVADVSYASTMHEAIQCIRDRTRRMADDSNNIEPVCWHPGLTATGPAIYDPVDLEGGFFFSYVRWKNVGAASGGAANPQYDISSFECPNRRNGAKKGVVLWFIYDLVSNEARIELAYDVRYFKRSAILCWTKRLLDVMQFTEKIRCPTKTMWCVDLQNSNWFVQAVYNGANAAQKFFMCIIWKIFVRMLAIAYGDAFRRQHYNHLFEMHASPGYCTI